MTFTTDQTYYEEHRRLASEYCKILHLRMSELRKQLKNCERAFVVAATIKRKCEEEIIPIKVIPIGVGRKDIIKEQDAMVEKIKTDAVFRKALKEMMQKEGLI